MSSTHTNIFSAAGCLAAGDLHTSLTIKEPPVIEDASQQRATVRAIQMVHDQALPMGHRIAARISLLIAEMTNPSPLFMGPMPKEKVEDIHAIIAAYRSGELDGSTTTWWLHGKQVDEPPLITYNPKKDGRFVRTPSPRCEAAIGKPTGFQC